MAFLAGETITATRLNRLQPRSYFAVGTSNLVGPQSNVDVPRCTVTLTTETARATYKAWIAIDHDMTNPSTTISFGRLAIDGVTQTNTTAAAQEVITDRVAVPQNYYGSVTTAGSHTFKVVGSPPANTQIL